MDDVIFGALMGAVVPVVVASISTFLSTRKRKRAQSRGEQTGTPVAQPFEGVVAIKVRDFADGVERSARRVSIDTDGVELEPGEKFVIEITDKRDKKLATS